MIPRGGMLKLFSKNLYLVAMARDQSGQPKALVQRYEAQALGAGRDALLPCCLAALLRPIVLYLPQ